MAFHLDIRDLLKSGRKLRDEREQHLRIAVVIDAEAPEAALEVLKDALRPHTGNARLHVEALVPGDVVITDESADAMIALAGSGDTVAASLERAREHFIPAAVLALGEERDSAAARMGHPVADTIVADSAEALVRELGRWLADRVSSKRLALAANFAFARRAVAEEAVKNTALQNGVVGGVAIIPGADMPIMTANQAKMVLQIAAAYGEPLGAERVRELAGVIGGAYLFRTVARQLVALVPGFGWALKAAIGYSGTIAMGYAAIDFFEHGGDLKDLPARLRESRDRAVARALDRSAVDHAEQDNEPRGYVRSASSPELALPVATSEPVLGDPDSEAGRS